MSHLSVVTVLPVDLLQGDSLAVEVRIKGAATDLVFEGLKNKENLQLKYYFKCVFIQKLMFSGDGLSVIC